MLKCIHDENSEQLANSEGFIVQNKHAKLGFFVDTLYVVVFVQIKEIQCLLKLQILTALSIFFAF